MVPRYRPVSRVLGISLCLLLLVANAAWGRSPQPSLPQLRLGGSAAYTHFSYLQQRDSDLIDARHELRFVPELEVEIADTLVVLAVEARHDIADTSRSRLALDRAYLDLSRQRWDLRLGRQIIDWGRTDGLKPTDSFKRHDLTDFLDRDEEPINALRVHYYLGEWTLEWVWAPLFEPNIFPLRPDNRWSALPTRQHIPHLGTIVLDYTINNAAQPVDDPRSSQIGLRVTRRHRGLDWSASYAYSFDRSPTFVTPKVVAPPLRNLARISCTFIPRYEMPLSRVNHFKGQRLFEIVQAIFARFLARRATIELTPVHKRIHVFGFDWETIIGVFGMRGAATYTLTADPAGTDPLIDDPYVRFVGGVDRTFAQIVSTHDLYVNLQYMLDTEVPRRGMNNQDDINVRLRHFFEHALTAHLEYRFSAFRKVVTRGFVNLVEGDFLLQLEWVWKPRDAWTLTLGGDFMDGPSASFFGAFRGNKRLRASLTFNF